MRLRVQDAAELLMVSQKTIYRWVSDGRLPGYRVNNTFRFDHAELLEWAMANRVDISPRFLEEPPAPEVIPAFHQALEAGGIAYRVGGTDRDSALRSAIDALRLGGNREFVFEALRAREQLASTGIGDGVALPHLRNPLRLQLERPGVSLCFLDEPVEWGALDRKPVSVLFIILASTVRSVLQLHSRTFFALRDRRFRAAVMRSASRDVLVAQAKRVSKSLPPPPAMGAVNEADGE